MSELLKSDEELLKSFQAGGEMRDTNPAAQKLSGLVAPILFPLFSSGCPTKNYLPKEGFPFFSLTGGLWTGTNL